MTGPKRWTALATQVLQDCQIFTVSRVDAVSPRTGNTHPFHRIDCPDWVNIVPVTEDGFVVFVRQFRHGAGKVTLEIPGGMVDPGESPGAAAAREMLEETGYHSDDVRPIGVVNPNPALFSNRCHTFVASDVRPIAEIANTGREQTAVELVAVQDVPHRLMSGEIEHALVVAALYWWSCRG